MNNHKAKKKYSAMERKAFYTGFGVGLTGNGSSSSGQTRKAFAMMTKKEQASYINGYEKGLDNRCVSSGCRDNKRWFS